MTDDGVFNSEDWYKRRYVMSEYQNYLKDKRALYSEFTKEEKTKYFKENRVRDWEFDPMCVKRFNKIINETNAKIVVSSTWRTDPAIKEILQSVNIKGLSFMMGFVDDSLLHLDFLHQIIEMQDQLNVLKEKQNTVL